MHRFHSIVLVILCNITFQHFAIAQTQRNTNEPQSSRQVHLDFHTSEFIPAIGEKFNKKQFQDALKAGHVNSINVFAKCHHSWSYYPTEIGKMHPNLKFDLLGAEMEACHEIGVKCPIYFTVGWSAGEAEAHPEWCARNKNGGFLTEHPEKNDLDFNANPDDIRPHYSWKFLSPVFGSEYHNHVMKQVEELCRRYKDLDGFWFDIYHMANLADYSPASRARMKSEGIDTNDTKAVMKSNSLAVKAHMKALRELVAKYHPNATVYFNPSPHIGDYSSFTDRHFDMNTHQDLEDLPTTWGGYDKLPIESKYHLAQGTPVTGMSGKFHKAWGEFGGFKHPDALKYEAAAMISYGASCNFGDQLHPSGEMDIETYRNIGEAYRYVEKIEQYGPGGTPVSNLGVWLTLKTEADRGVVNMLLEMHKDFVFANEKNLDKLSLVIIPGRSCLTPEQAALLNAWTKKGGKLIVFGKGALDKEEKKFLLDIGAEYKGPSAFHFDYTVMKAKEMSRNMVSTPFLNYEPALAVSTTTAQVLAAIRNPYFNRTYQKYSGHRETPYQLEDAANPAVLRNGNIIFFAHPLDQLYYAHAVRLHRELVNNAIDVLYTQPMLTVKHLPSAGRVSFLNQRKQKRYIAHLLYTPPLQRGEVAVIEDFVPVSGITIIVDVPEKIVSAMEIPSGKKLILKKAGNKIIVSVPTFTMHTGIVLNY
jgi:Hypothetical glycosyl hydrolase 6